MKILAAVALILVTACDSPAAAQSDHGWSWGAGLSVGLVVGESDWSVSHPIYEGASVTTETFSGSFRHLLHLEAGLEARRGHLGLRGTLGFLPQEFAQADPPKEKHLTLLMGGLAVVLYAAPPEGRFEPWISAGAGGQRAVGDMENTGFYLSGGAGLATGLGSHVKLHGGIQVFRLKYTQIDLAPDITKDVPVYPVSLSLGIWVGT